MMGTFVMVFAILTAFAWVLGVFDTSIPEHDHLEIKIEVKCETIKENFLTVEGSAPWHLEVNIDGDYYKCPVRN